MKTKITTGNPRLVAGCIYEVPILEDGAFIAYASHGVEACAIAAAERIKEALIAAQRDNRYYIETTLNLKGSNSPQVHAGYCEGEALTPAIEAARKQHADMLGAKWDFPIASAVTELYGKIADVSA